MAHGAALFCLNGPTFGVAIEEIRSMIRGLQIRPFIVALHAAEGRIDLVMANEAIRHSWKCRGGNLIRVVESTMAGSTGDSRGQMAANIPGC
jgi:hypothetical protein